MWPGRGPHRALVGKWCGMNIDWSKWALLTVLALYAGTWIGVWWAIELMVREGTS